MNSPKVFADTAFFLALMRSNDSSHSKAVAEAEIDREIVTSEFILLELGNACCRARHLEDFLILVEGVRSSPRVTVIPLHTNLLDRGLVRMSERPDKNWSLTDCISFIVMEDLGIRDALTTDRHFEQAGFRALLRSISS